MLRVVEETDYRTFEKKCDKLLSDGFVISSSNCSWSEQCACQLYQAILCEKRDIYVEVK